MTEWIYPYGALVLGAGTLIAVGIMIVSVASAQADNLIQPLHPVRGFMFLILGAALEVPIELLRTATDLIAPATATADLLVLAVASNWMILVANALQYVAIAACLIIFILRSAASCRSGSVRGVAGRQSHRDRDNAHPTTTSQTTADRRGAPSRAESPPKRELTHTGAETPPDGGTEPAAETTFVTEPLTGGTRA